MLHRVLLPIQTVALCVFLSPADALAIATVGSVDVTAPLGQFLSLSITVDDTSTTFEMTGPDYSYFAFGFDTTMMSGYSLIVAGLGDNRTVVEQNLLGSGNPGTPQTTQNINVLNTIHDAEHDLTTVVVERPNHTGDPGDPDFTTGMTTLDVIWAYNSFASPGLPDPNPSYHGSNGRGSARITFAPVPEPSAALLAAIGLAAMSSAIRIRCRQRWTARLEK